MAGLWTNTLQPLTDMAAVDAAELAEETPPQPIFIRNLAQPVTNQSFVQLGLINEDEALRLILQSTPVSLPTTPESLSRNRSPTPSNPRSHSSSRASSPLLGSQPSRTQSPVPRQGSRGPSPLPRSGAPPTPLAVQILRGASAHHPEALTRLVHGQDVYETEPDFVAENAGRSPSPEPEPEQENAEEFGNEGLDFYNTTPRMSETDLPNNQGKTRNSADDISIRIESKEPSVSLPDPDVRERSAESQISNGDIVSSTPSMEWDEERTAPAPDPVVTAQTGIEHSEVGSDQSSPEPDMEQESLDSNGKNSIVFPF